MPEVAATLSDSQPRPRRPTRIVAALSLSRRDLRVLRARLTPIADTDRDVSAILRRLAPVPGGVER